MEDTTLAASFDISIVITTCSRAVMLRHALQSLFAQRFTQPLRVEMIVVDDRSIDDTLAVLTELQPTSPFPLTILTGPRTGVAAARNLAASAASGTWLASFDDDEIAPLDWLDTLYTAALAHHADCVGGTTTLLLPPGHTLDELGPRARRLMGEVSGTGAPRPFAAGSLPATNNVLVRRSVFELLGGFNIHFTEGGEDTDLFDRMRNTGHTLWFVPAACVQHVTPPARMDPNRLKLTALRFGSVDARYHWSRSPILGLTTSVLSRLALALVRDLPLLLLASLRNDNRSRLDTQCSLNVTLGLLRTLPALRSGRSSFLDQMDFRTRHGERPDPTKK